MYRITVNWAFKSSLCSDQSYKRRSRRNGSYFPVGEERIINAIDQQGFNSWGGLDIGSDQLYATQVVDGRVSMFGGESLSRELEKIPFVAQIRPSSAHLGTLR